MCEYKNSAMPWCEIYSEWDGKLLIVDFKYHMYRCKDNSYYYKYSNNSGERVIQYHIHPTHGI